MARIPSLFALVACLVLALPASAADLDNNGTFRFLNESLPTGSTNAEYVAQLRVVNADGPVVFGAANLAPGMTIDTASGFITGRPTSTWNDDVTLSADDGVSMVQLVVNLKVNASGGGGNAGATFALTSLPQGRVGEAYTVTLGLNDGVGPFVFGASNLPPGLHLNGLTGEITGAPTAPGTFYASLTVVDFGENNKVVTVLPLEVLPAGSDFRFVTAMLNNGEVGTPYCDQWETIDAGGAVSFGASGLPEGLLLDPATGEVTGTPTADGTFVVNLQATDGGETIRTQLLMTVVPSDTSTFHWDFSSIPAALVGVSYDRQPPILLNAINGDSVTYSAIGLPTGLTYSPTSGELAGTAVEAGVVPVTFTATDATSGEIIDLMIDFVVLPPSGGDAESIPVNFWVLKQRVKSGNPGKDAWVGSAIWNADRRTGNVFDPMTDPCETSMPNRTISVAPGSFAGSTKKLSAKSDKGVVPTESVSLSLAKQTIKWSSKRDTLTEVFPNVLRHTMTLGGRGFRIDEEFDEKGVFKPPYGFQRPAFVVRTGKLVRKGGGDDSAKLSLLLADPDLFYEEGTSTLRVRILDGAGVILDRDFSALGAAKVGVDNASGRTTYAIKATKDSAATERIRKFKFQSRSGKATLVLDDFDLGPVPGGEAHLGVELSIHDRIYGTAVTFFETKAGRYTTTMP